MSNLKKNVITFFVCVVLSLVFHIALLFGLSDYTGFTFFALHDEDTISVSLENEDSQKPLPASGKLYSQRTFTGKTRPQQQDLSLENPAGSENEPSSEDNANEVLPSEAAPASTGTTPAAPEPVQLAKYSRETLTYDIYWMGIYAGTAVLEAENKNGIFKITSRVQSAPVVSAFYRVEDHAESIVTNGLPFKFRIKLQEGYPRNR